MALAPRYPESRYEPSPLIDLSGKAERERLSPSAIKAFFNIMEKWNVRDEDARREHQALEELAERVNAARSIF